MLYFEILLFINIFPLGDIININHYQGNPCDGLPCGFLGNIINIHHYQGNPWDCLPCGFKKRRPPKYKKILDFSYRLYYIIEYRRRCVKMDTKKLSPDMRTIPVFKKSHDILREACKKRNVPQIHLLNSLFLEMQNDKLFCDEIFRRYSKTMLI